MPTYEYECLECKHRFDLFHSIKDETLKKCEKCGNDVKKIIGAAGIIFKGEGFYVNDYKNKKSGSNSGKKDSKQPKVKEKAESSPCSSCDACPSN